MRRPFLLILFLAVVVLFASRDPQFETSAAGPQRPALFPIWDGGPISPTWVVGKTAIVNFGTDELPDYATCVQSNTVNSATVVVLGYHPATGDYRRLWQSEINQCMDVAAADSVGDERLELFVLGEDGFVTAYDSADGHVLRRARVTDEYDPIPADLVAGDVDGDGRSEVVVAHGYTTYVLSADHLTPEWEVNDRGSSYVFAGNFDDDSDIELLVRTNYISWLLDAAHKVRDGRLAVVLGTVTSVGDVDGDPQTEILHVEESRAAVFDPTTGTERWGVDAPFGGAFVDTDGDGRMEVVVGKGDAASGLDVLSGETGASLGSIATPGYVPVAGQNAADLDGDGTRELIWYGQRDEPPWQFFIGNLTASEVEAQFGSMGEDLLLTLADLDSDGIPERIVANMDSGTVEGESVSIFDGRTGSLEQGLVMPGTNIYTISAIGVGQTDNDPAREIVVAEGTSFSSQLVIFDAATRQMQWAGETQDFREMYRLDVANMDADATDEIILGYLDTTVVMLDGATGVTQWSTDAPGYELADIAVGDADGDGSQDLAVITQEQWMLYRGPTFDLVHQGQTYGYAIAIGNRDQQGPGEIIVPGYYWDGEGHSEVWVYHGQTLELIAARPMTFLNEPDTYSIAVGDFDADGVQEYAFAGWVDDPAKEQPSNLSFLMIDNYYNALPWPEFTRIEELGQPRLLVAANVDSDPQIELAYSSSAIARLFDIRVEDFIAHTSRVPLVLKNWPRPVEKRFVDQFSDPASGWPVVSNAVADLFYDNSRYNIEVHVPDTMVSALSPAPFTLTDYTLDVDARSAHNARAYGVLYDWTDWDNYNAVLIAPGEDQVGVFQVRDGELLIEYPWNHFSYLESGNNHIRIERQDWVVRIFINGQPLLGHIIESNGENVRTGLVMLSVGNGSQTAAFDNFDWREKWWGGEPPNPTKGPSILVEQGERTSVLWQAMPMPLK